MVLDHEGEHASRWAAVSSIAAKIGCTAQTLHEWVKKAERDSGVRAGVPTDVATKLKALGTREPRASAGQRDPAQGERVFCPGGARPPVQAMIAFIDDHRQAHGVEPICRVLPIALSTYHAHVAKRVDPSRLSARDRRDAALRRRSGACLRRTSGSTGSARSGGNCSARTSGCGPLHGYPPDEGHAASKASSAASRSAPRRATRRRHALSITLIASSMPRRQHAMGLRLHLRRDLDRLRLCRLCHRHLCPPDRRLAGERTAHASFVLDALEQALHDRRPAQGSRLVHHSDRGSHMADSSGRLATRSLSADRRNRSSASAGVFQSSVFRGRELRAAATAAISLALCMLRSVPLGKYWRSSPLVFSLVPRCHGL